MALSLPNTVTSDYSIKQIIDSSSNTAISTTLPTSRTIGEGMVACICSTRNALSDITGIPTGWQLEAKRATGATTHPFVWIFSKIVDGTEDGGANATTFTWSGGTPADTGDDVCLIRMVRGNVDTSDMIGAISAVVTGASVSPAAPAITTLADNSLVMYFACAVNGNRITAVDSNYPSGSTGLLARATRAFSVGQVYAQAYVAVPTAGTSKGSEPFTNLLNNAATNWAAISFEIKSSSVSITDVNGGNGVKVGSTGNTITFSGAFALSSLTFGSIAATNIALVSGTTYSYDIPLQVDNTTAQSYGSKTVTAGNGSTSLTSTANYLPLNGYTYITLEAPIDQTINGVVYNFSPVAAVGDQIAFKTPETTITKYASGTTTITGVQTLWHWSLSTGKAYSFVLTTGTTATGLGSPTLSIRALEIRPLTIRKAA